MSDITTLEHDPPPSPSQRKQVIWLGTAIAAPPVFWVLQLLVLSAFSTYACFPGDTPLTEPVLGGVGPLSLACDVIAILATTASGIVSLRHYRLSHARMRQHNDSLSLWHIDRHCFLGMAGILSAGGFLLAIIFEIIASILVPTCGR